jgi:hypothetical protein
MIQITVKCNNRSIYMNEFIKIPQVTFSNCW